MSNDNSSAQDDDWIWSPEKKTDQYYNDGGQRRDSGGDLDPKTVRLIFLVASVLLVPFAFVLYYLIVRVWKSVQFSPKWLYITTGVITLVGVVTGFVGERGLRGMLEALAAMFSTEGNLGDNILGGIPSFLVAQTPLAIVLGLAAASWKVFSLKRELKKRKEVRGEEYLDQGFLMKRKAKKTRAQIEKGTNSPDKGYTVGVARDPRDPNGALGEPGEEYGKRVVLTPAELSAHAFVVGGSGSGKTQTMLAMARDAIRQGNGMVFVDCKGGPDVAEKIAEYAERYGRPFHHWTIHDPETRYAGPAPDGPSYYDPIARGDASRRKDLLIGAMKWDMEYYRSVISNFLQTLFRVKDLVPPLTATDTLTDVTDLLSHNALIHRARYIDPVDHPELVSTLTRFQDADATERSGIRSMYMRLHTIITSVAGHWMRMDPEGKKDIDLRRVADEGQVVVFSLDTSNYEETAQLIAGLIVQDLKTLSSELRLDPAERPLQVFIDEFSAVDSTNILGLLNKARDAKVSCVLATQALADLARTVPTFKEQVLSIVSTFIFHRTNTSEDAEVYAGLSGVEKQVKMSSGADGRVFEYEHEDSVVSRGEFQKLRQGEAIIVVKSPELRYINYVEVVVENPNVPSSERDPALPAPTGRPRRTIFQEKKTYPHPELVRLQKAGQAPTGGKANARPQQTASATQNKSSEDFPDNTIPVKDSTSQIEQLNLPSLPRKTTPSRPGLPVRPSSAGKPNRVDPSNASGKPAGAPMPNVGKNADDPKKNNS